MADEMLSLGQQKQVLLRQVEDLEAALASTRQQLEAERLAAAVARDSAARAWSISTERAFPTRERRGLS